MRRDGDLLVSDWSVLKTADALRPGDRFIFGPEIGGDGEVLTVESAANAFGAVEVQTEELDFTIDLVSIQPVMMAEEEES